MLRLVRTSFFEGTCATAFISLRRVSTRQAERPQRRTAAATADTAGKQPAAGLKAAHTPWKESAHVQRGYAKLTSGAAARTSKARRGADTSTSTAAAASTSAGPSKPPMRGRFNRLVVERGFFFTVYLYVLGESLNLSLAYLLHTHGLGIGDAGSWLAALHFPTDRVLNVGPTLYGLQLSPRLVLNYLVANVCTYPLLPLQLRFCAVTAPVLQAPFLCIGRAMRRAEPAIPKAPAARP